MEWTSSPEGFPELSIVSASHFAHDRGDVTEIKSMKCKSYPLIKIMNIDIFIILYILMRVYSGAYLPSLPL